MDTNKILNELLSATITFRINVSDTFEFACADSEAVDIDDIQAMLPLIEQYGPDAFTAYVAVKRDMEPISCQCCWDGPGYQKAKEEILKLKDSGKLFFT